MYPVKTHVSESVLPLTPSDLKFYESFCAVDKSLLPGKDKVRFRESHSNLWTLFVYVCAFPTPSSIYSPCTSMHMIKHSVHSHSEEKPEKHTHTRAQTRTRKSRFSQTNIFSPHWSVTELWIAVGGKETYSGREIWFDLKAEAPSPPQPIGSQASSTSTLA